ncbi:MAG: two-component system sensor histidine kinase NtrB [Planctomycetota bacterium]|jgi:two-component system sensor kinase FixL
MTDPQLAEPNTSIIDDLRWFVRLRWAAASVTLVGTAANAMSQGWSAAHTRVLIVALTILAYNLPFWLIQRASGARLALPRVRVVLAWGQILLDLVALTLLTVWTGGLASPLLGLTVIHVVFASLLLRPPSAYGVVTVAMLLVFGTLWLTGRWPDTQDEHMIGLGWAMLLLLTAYVSSRIVSSLRRHERELETQGRRTRAILDTAADGIVTITEQGVIRSLNPAAEQIFGYRADEMVGRNVAMLMPEPFASEHDGYLREYLQTGDARIIGIGREVEGRRRDGSTFPLDLAVSEVPLGHERIFTGILRDISDRKQAEDELRQLNAELKRQQQAMIQSEKMAAMGQLAAGVAHEISNPLASLDSLLQLVAKHPERLDEATGKQLRTQVTRISRIVQQMMDFAHPNETGWERRDLNEVITSGLDIMRFDRRLRDIQIVRDFDPDAGEITLMPLAIQQVVINLLLNALDAVADVEQPRIVISTRPDNDWCVVEVADNGVGIEPEAINRVFEPFFTTKPLGKGTGLGLSITYSLVRRHGGRCDVESTPGDGTRFILRLPRVPPDPDTGSDEPGGIPDSENPGS